MTCSFIHTADWQIGKPFGTIPDPAKRALVQHKRIEVLKRIAQVARDHDAEFVLVAGDLFDSPRATKSDAAALCKEVGQMQVPVIVIPGNHDHGGPGSLWEESFFVEARTGLAANLRVALTPDLIELDSAVILPCPLVRRHESSDTTAWIRTLDLDAFGDKPRIVLAHGSVQGFGGEGGEDEESAGAPQINQIDLDRLPASGLDYVALGDWHGTKKVNIRTWYAGTPEPDRFPKGGDYQSGQVLAVRATRGELPAVEPVATGQLAWWSDAFVFSDDASLPLFDTRIRGRIGDHAQSDLALLEISGSLGIAAAERLRSILDQCEALMLRLKLRDTTSIAPTQDEIDALVGRTTDPVVAGVAARLIEESRGEGEPAEIARTALRELYATIQTA